MLMFGLFFILNPGKLGKINSGTGINVNYRPHRNAAIISKIRRQDIS